MFPFILKAVVYIKFSLISIFQLVTSFRPKDFNLVSANKLCNQMKNRTLDLLPVESARVHLTPKPGVDGSDYINATWFQGKNTIQSFCNT